MLIKTIAPVSVELVSLSEVRQQLRLPDDPSEDEPLMRLIGTAREYCEHFTRRALAEQTFELVLDRFPVSRFIPLPCPPLRSVLHIIYRDSSGVDLTLEPTKYVVDMDSGQVVLTSGAAWPVFTPYPVSPIRIRFTAGYEALPPTIRHAILMLIGHWYENREATGTASSEISFSVHALLAPYRVEVF